MTDAAFSGPPIFDPEVAAINVNGQTYTQWKSVMVKCPAPGAGPFREFQFTSSEDVTPQGTYQQNPQFWQVKPGDAVTITLGGQLVLTGFCNVRQVFYDKEQHGIMIAGRGRMQDVVDSAAVPMQAAMSGGKGEYRGQPWTAIAAQLVGTVGVGLVPFVVNNQPFEEAQISPGESIYNFLERLARKRGIIMGEDPLGNLLASQIGVPLGVGEKLVESVNIQEARITFRDDSLNSPMMGWGQQKGNDQSNSQQSAQISAFQIQPGVNRYRPALIAGSSPMTQADLQQLVMTETAWAATTQIDAEITVQGWFSSPGNLWKPGYYIPVFTPMGPLTQSLYAWVVTFMQDNYAGTTTRIELKQWATQAMSWRNAGTGDQNQENPQPAVPQQPEPPPLSPNVSPGASVPGAGTAL